MNTFGGHTKQTTTAMEAAHVSGPDVGALVAVLLVLLGIYVAVMYLCWGTLSMTKVRMNGPVSQLKLKLTALA